VAVIRRSNVLDAVVNNLYYRHVFKDVI